MAAVDLLVPGDIEALTGGYIYDRRILQGLKAQGWTTHVHALDASFPEPTPAALREAEALLSRIPHGRRVVIDGLALAGLTPLLETQAARLELFALIHHPLALETGLSSAAAARLDARERAALALVPRVIVTSGWTRRELGRLGVAAERIAVVEPGIERGEPAAPGRSPTLRMLCVGTLTPRKGHAVLVDALAPLAGRDWQLRCAGSLERDPETVAGLRRRIRELALDDRVELLGELAPEAVAHEYRQADLFVLPSFLEGFGMAIAEAVAHGLPVISTTAGAIPDTLPAGAGLLVAPGDEAALTREIGRLLDDRTALEALAAAALAARERLPHWADQAARFGRLLESWEAPP